MINRSFFPFQPTIAGEQDEVQAYQPPPVTATPVIAHVTLPVTPAVTSCASEFLSSENVLQEIVQATTG